MSRGRIIREAPEAVRIAGSARRVAVLGIRSASYASRPAHFVPDYLAGVGVEIVPVPVGAPPETTQILGRPVVRSLRSVAGPIDVLDVFRRPQDLHQHLDDVIALKPRVVWLQSGISDQAFENAVADAGIDVVVSRCLKVDRAAYERAKL